MKIIHIIDSVSWRAALDKGSVGENSLKEYHYVHCCLPDQLTGVLETWFPDDDNLVVLEIESDLLTSEVRFENLEGGRELFPHVYGLINLDAVVKWYPSSS